ncbi:hypothetical protein LIER_05417 [Lithospermum erythrorhizon]|uniref:Uncharacterized protein n=1 Tax=Lithospermum erythrorhizon TaxID=34254 RepID=A0AAV3P1Q6_LITER
MKDLGLLGARLVLFPMEQNHGLGTSTSALLQDVERYRRLVGRLIYLSFTLLDFSFAVHVFSQFLHEPRQDHWVAALRVVKYLKGSPGQGILLRTNCDLNLTEGTIQTSHVSTNEQLADIFTKSLGRKQFEFLLRKLGIHDLHAPT